MNSGKPRILRLLRRRRSVLHACRASSSSDLFFSLDGKQNRTGSINSSSCNTINLVTAAEINGGYSLSIKSHL
ncbi:hypothetical protein AAC387_Pa07g1502 [Persea americana]